MILRSALALLAFFVPLLTWASGSVVASQASPGAVLNVNISLDNDGRVMYSVTPGSQPMQSTEAKQLAL